ncbi:MAG TPA: hypothetical protein VKE27_09100 [Candidatus Dormibacteraeota bacterium]|nr:hypothetical protein [Candidatus Dormibacteraeota bacterium]
MKVAPGAAVMTLAAGGLAGLAFLSLGEPANHPQMEMARAAVGQLQRGARPASVVPARGVDIATSTDPFIIVTDSQQNVLASSASLSGSAVLPPPGVFASAVRNREDKVTWQPAPNVRAWIVVDAYRDGFVIAGRSPGDAEQSEYVFLLWGSVAALALAGIAGLALILRLRLGGGGGS